MGTRSAIGFVRPDGSCCTVYCHWDGYPSHHLPILLEHYNTLEKAQKLVEPGSMSSLRTTHTWESETIPDNNGRFGTKQDENGDTVYTCTREPQPLYYFERGDGDPPVISSCQAACERHFTAKDCEHLYVYEPQAGWQHYKLGSGSALAAFII
jgi:hypothetical protein